MPPLRQTGQLDVAPDRRAAVAAALPAPFRLWRGFDVTPAPAVDRRWQVSERFGDRAAVDRHRARVRARGAIGAGPVRRYTIEETAT